MSTIFTRVTAHFLSVPHFDNFFVIFQRISALFVIIICDQFP